MSDILGLTTIVTLYQAGNGIYDLFDKVLVLDGGKQIYYGPMRQAKPFMEEQGFICQHGANVADFLTGVTVPTERQIRPGMKNQFPRTPDALRLRYQESPTFGQMTSELEFPATSEAVEKTKRFREGVARKKNPNLSSRSPFTVSFPMQVRTCIIRQYQIIWGDKPTFVIKQVSTLVQALISGSLFYNAPNTSAGLFIKSGALFFSLLYNSLLAMSEVTDSFTGRPVLLKHKAFALFHPAAFCIAQIAADIPVLLFQISLFSVVLYFMAGLTISADIFFTYWVLLLAVSMVSRGPLSHGITHSADPATVHDGSLPRHRCDFQDNGRSFESVGPGHFAGHHVGFLCHQPSLGRGRTNSDAGTRAT